MRLAQLTTASDAGPDPGPWAGSPARPRTWLSSEARAAAEASGRWRGPEAESPFPWSAAEDKAERTRKTGPERQPRPVRARGRAQLRVAPTSLPFIRRESRRDLGVPGTPDDVTSQRANPVPPRPRVPGAPVNVIDKPTNPASPGPHRPAHSSPFPALLQQSGSFSEPPSHGEAALRRRTRGTASRGKAESRRERPGAARPREGSRVEGAPGAPPQVAGPRWTVPAGF